MKKSQTEKVEKSIKFGNMVWGVLLYIPSVLFRLLANLPGAILGCVGMCIIAAASSVAYLVLTVFSCFKVLPTEYMLNSVKNWYSDKKFYFKENISSRFKRSVKPMAVRTAKTSG